MDSTSEQGIWSCKSKDAETGLTSYRIINEEGEIEYANGNKKRTVVSSLSDIHERFPDDSVSLKIGYGNNLFFNGLMSEFLLFNQRIDNEELIKWLSYLSIKYGITLQETNYVNSRGDTIWNYDKSPEYSLSIAGLGCDTSFGLNQKKSRFLNDKVIIGTNDILNENNFILMGCDETLLNDIKVAETDIYDSLLYYGNCMMQVTGETAHQAATFLTINADNWEGDLNQYKLLINRKNDEDFFTDFSLFSPTHIDTLHRLITFSNIFWDTDGDGKDFFKFIYINSHQGLQNFSFIPNYNITNSDTNQVINKEDSYLLYPNPNFGNFSLQIDLTEAHDIQVKILTITGQVIDIINGYGQQHYLFNKFLPTQGYFLIDIVKGSEHKTLKMIVQ